MKKILFAACLFMTTSTVFSQDGRVGINIDDPMATLHIHGTLRFDSPYVSLSPTYVLTLDNMDSNIHRLSVDSLGIVLSKSVQKHSDIIGWGYSTFTSSGNVSPPVSFFKDCPDKVGISPLGGVGEFSFEADSSLTQERNATLDWTTITYLSDFFVKGGVVCMDGYLYIAMRYQATSERRIYRYDRNNINAGGTRMQFTGPSLNDTGEPLMTSNGKDFFFTYNAGNSAGDNVIARYSVSGAVFTYISSATIGSSGDFEQSFLVDSDNNYYGLSFATPAQIKKFSSYGSLLYSRPTRTRFLLNWSDHFYSSGLISNYFEKFNK